MSDTRSADDFLTRLEAGEFDGRAYETIANLSTSELEQIIALLANRRAAGSAPCDN